MPALTAYDLPDLIAAAAPNKVAVVNPLDQMGSPASDEVINKDYNYVKALYTSLKSADRLKIEKTGQKQINVSNLLGWLTK